MFLQSKLEANLEKNNLRNSNFFLEEIMNKFGSNGNMVPRDISAIKNKSITLYRGKKKNALRAS